MAVQGEIDVTGALLNDLSLGEDNLDDLVGDAEQIKELEKLFEECPHPNRKQKLEIADSLNIDVIKIKFWFQNKRLQAELLAEQREKVILMQERVELLEVRELLIEALMSTLCEECRAKTDAEGMIASLMKRANPEPLMLKIDPSFWTSSPVPTNLYVTSNGLTLVVPDGAGRNEPEGPGSDDGAGRNEPEGPGSDDVETHV